MVATWNPAAASTYYTRSCEYYLGGVEPQGRWYAPAGDHGLVDGAPVERAHFERLYAALDDTGRSLVSNAGGRTSARTPAFDVTLSAPRSVSLLWAFGDPDLRAAIEEVQDRAARAALDCLSREASFARRGRGGQTLEAVALSSATFQHGESRPAEHEDGRVFGDPNLHTHCVCLNLATRADGTVGALHSKVMRDAKLLTGATYHAALAEGLQQLGFGLDRIDYNGTFEIAGIGEDAIGYFSARRREIEDELAEHGATSSEAAALAAAITKATRGAKALDGGTPRETVWREAAEARGLDVEALASTCREVGRAVDVEAGERRLAERLQALPRAATETTSVLERREVLRAVTSALVGTGLPAARAGAATDALIARGAFVEIGRDALGLPRYSTPEMVALEQNVVRLAGALAASRHLIVDIDALLATCTRQGLSAEQTEAARAAVAPRALSIIEGAPGSGKTTALAPVVAAYRDAGCRVIGAASAWRIARMLEEDLGIEARATASWLARLERDPQTLDANTVLIVDEAGLLSSREMHALLEEANRSGAKLVLCGDRDQLQAIGAGPGFQLVQRAIDAARVDRIVRQTETWARDAVRAFGSGEAGAALQAFDERGLLVEAPSARAAVRAVVEAWAAAREACGDEGVLVLAKTNAAVAAISRAVREQLRADGEIAGPEITITAATPSGHAQALTLAKGDRIRFQVRNDALGVINGTTGVVRQISMPDPALQSPEPTITAEIDGRRITFSPSVLQDERGRARLGWAYASSIYGSQGLTVDRAVVLLDPALDRHDVYVAASRARERTTLVVDTGALDRRILMAREHEEASSKTVGTAERRAWLADKLSRAQAKLSTVAVIEASAPDREAQRARRERQRDYAHER